MGKFLRPRRGNVNEAVYENIVLYKGEILLEYPEGRGVGKSPGRIIIGTGDDPYNRKKDVTNNPDDYQPFITDPSIYVPIFSDSSPSTEYDYEDNDRGATLLGSIISGVTKLPVLIGFIKKILCRHTDNLRYDNDRIKALEQAIANINNLNVIDIKTKFIVVHGTYPNYLYINADVDDGYEFLKWDQICVENASPISRNVLVPLEPYRKSTNAYPISGSFDYTKSYICYYTMIKRPTNN